jgi:phosphoenolpyruvate carboxylase
MYWPAGRGLLDSDPTLQRSIKLRNPYIDPMHSCKWIYCSAGAQQAARIGAVRALRATISGTSVMKPPADRDRSSQPATQHSGR